MLIIKSEGIMPLAVLPDIPYLKLDITTAMIVIYFIAIFISMFFFTRPNSIMTKLVEWLVTAGALGAIWIALLTNKIENSFARDHYTLLLVSPIIFCVLFGLFALALVLYRVFTFNNCDEAAEELQKEILEAKADLRRLGFKFKEETT